MPKPGHSAYHFGEFVIDESSFELWHKGRRVPLERRAYDLIVHLIRHRDRVVTKDELLEHVWKRRFVGESVIARCVSTARKMLLGVRAIETVYGRGYRWVLPVTISEVSENSTCRGIPEESTPTERYPVIRPWSAGPKSSNSCPRR